MCGVSQKGLNNAKGVADDTIKRNDDECLDRFNDTTLHDEV